MEGPPVKIVALSIQGFVGQVLVDAGGNAKVNKQQFLHQVCTRIHAIGKNLFFEFKEKSFKLHFLMYGSYRVNEEKYRGQLRLRLKFDGGDVFNFYDGSVKILTNAQVLRDYDETLDILSDEWNPSRVVELLQDLHLDDFACDALLDQSILPGVGNIIKNEALFMTGVHPNSLVRDIPDAKLSSLIKNTRKFSQLFFKVKQEGHLVRNYCRIYQKGTCDTCKGKIMKEKAGKLNRINHYCVRCQDLY